MNIARWLTFNMFVHLLWSIPTRSVMEYTEQYTSNAPVQTTFIWLLSLRFQYSVYINPILYKNLTLNTQTKTACTIFIVYMLKYISKLPFLCAHKVVIYYIWKGYIVDFSSVLHCPRSHDGNTFCASLFVQLHASKHNAMAIVIQTKNTITKFYANKIFREKK